MKKRKVELIMGLLLIISFVSLIINITDKGKEELLNDEKYIQTTLYSDENDLYSNYHYIENKLFQTYFVVGICRPVTYINKKEELRDLASVGKEINNEFVKEKIVVNRIKYSSSYNGKEAEEGKEYITINVTSYNNENYGRLVRFSANLSYNTDLKDFKFEQEKLYREAKYNFPEEVDTYGFRFDDTLNKTVMVKNKSDDVNMFYIAPDSSVTYNVTYEIDKGQRNGLALRCYNNKDLRSNSDYIILLY